MDNGCGRGGVHAQAGWCNDGDGAVTSGIGGDRLVGRCHQGIKYRGTGRGERRVAWPQGLWTASGKVNTEVLAGHRYFGVNTDRLVGNAIVVDIIFELISAV